MKKQKYYIIVLTLLGLLVFSACAAEPASAVDISVSESPAQQAAQPTLYFFHDTACGSCDDTKEFYELFDEVLAEEKKQFGYTLQTYNVFETAGRDAYERVLRENGIAEEHAATPVLIVNGAALSGWDTMQKKLREMFLSACESANVPSDKRYLVEKASADKLFEDMQPDANDSVVVYFYRITCDECIETKPILEALPQSLSINGTDSAVKIYPLNTRTGSNGERIRALFKKYNVPQEDQMVPIVFLRSTYLSGYDKISSQLQKALENGEGQNFSFPQ